MYSDLRYEYFVSKSARERLTRCVGLGFGVWLALVCGRWECAGNMLRFIDYLHHITVEIT